MHEKIKSVLLTVTIWFALTAWF